MTTSSTETETDHGIDVVLFVTRLHKAAAAGRALLNAVEAAAHREPVRGAVWDAAEAARAAYDRLDDAAQKEAT